MRMQNFVLALSLEVEQWPLFLVSPYWYISLLLGVSGSEKTGLCGYLQAHQVKTLKKEAIAQLLGIGSGRNFACTLPQICCRYATYVAD